MRLLMSHSEQSSWRIVVKPEVAAAAYAAAKNVASRLRDKENLQKAAELAIQQTQFPHLIQNTAYSVTGGNAGLALLFSALDTIFPEERWDIIGHEHLQIAISALESLPTQRRSLALSFGLSGILLATWLLSHNGTRYHKLRSTLEKKTLPHIRAFAEGIAAGQTHGCTDTLYDQISGLAGMGVYLLSCYNEPEVAEILPSVLEALIYLTAEKNDVPHWYIPPHLASNKSWITVYPDGYLNCGLAHGIPGPLALLSLAKCNGIDLPDLDVAIKRAADWLTFHHIENEWGVNWPLACPVGRFTDIPNSIQNSRTAWCYGTPGVARALWLAGKALDCAKYRDLALAGIQSVYRRPLAARNINSPSFCHGIAGLLQITLRFVNDTGDIGLSNGANDLCEQLLTLYQPNTLLGYRHLESDEVFVDHPWLLDGAAGIALVLLAASTRNEPTWDRFFLLS